ncbi:aldo/keto reductase [Microbacterium sp. 4R-513]|uniref:aldo/keto reductase n=1 Tax=Microbacterium sp. 4R-513 TaxID=2567934 RepID=UPI003219D0C0
MDAVLGDGGPVQPAQARGGTGDDPDVPRHGSRTHALLPVGKGRLTRPWGQQTQRAEADAVAKTFDSPADGRIVDVVERIAGERGLPMAQIALAWVLRNPVVAAPIVGATKDKHLADAVAALDVILTDDEVTRLEAPYTPQDPYWY